MKQRIGLGDLCAILTRRPSAASLFLLICLGWSFGSPTPSYAQGNTIAGKAAQLDSLFQALFDQSVFHGNVLIADQGEIIFEKSYGFAQLRDSTPLNLETTFELASVTKQFTAAGILVLLQAGKLDLDIPFTDYLPELAFYKGITIRNLLTHTSGLPDYMRLMEEHWDHTRIAVNQDVIDLIAQLQPTVDMPPNTELEYSNTNYLLLASIIERVSGQSYGDFLKAVLFEPLGMTHTFLYCRRYAPMALENDATAYYLHGTLQKLVTPDELTTPSEAYYLDGTYGDGSIVSNLHDLLRWDQALYEDEILADSTRVLLFQNHQLPDSTATNYGFGWQIQSNNYYGKIVRHSGSWRGYLSYLERHPERRKTIIILQNVYWPDSKVPINQVRKLLHDQPLHQIIDLTPADLEKVAGRYRTKSGNTRQIERRENQLFVVLSEYFQYELKPLSPTRFVIDDYTPEVFYDFHVDASGQITHYTLTRPETGLRSEGQRVN